MMKNLSLFVIIGLILIPSAVLRAESRDNVKAGAPATASSFKPVIELDEAAFIDQIFDYRTATEWSYKGDVPAIIDFYAVWCGPCKRLAPVLAELQNEYKGKIQVYKVDAEKNRELAAAFGVTAYPTMLFIPMGAEPAGARGLLPKEELERIVGEFLKVRK